MSAPASGVAAWMGAEADVGCQPRPSRQRRLGGSGWGGGGGGASEVSAPRRAVSGARSVAACGVASERVAMAMVRLASRVESPREREEEGWRCVNDQIW